MSSNEIDDDEPAVETRPLYRLTCQHYTANDRLLEVGQTLVHIGEPPWYMEPANAAAKAVVKKTWPDGRPAYIDPVQRLSLVNGSEASESAKLIAAMAEQTKALTALIGQKRA